MAEAMRPLRDAGRLLSNSVPVRGMMVVALCLLAAAVARPQSVQEPAPGVLLVAAERMGDPRFNQAVILLVEHGRSGSWGLVINKRTDIELSELLASPLSTGEPAKVYYGGPVQVDHLSLIYRADTDRDDGGTSPLPGVRWSDSEDALKERLEGHADDTRVYAGYAGWAPGQLESEIARGGWRMIQGREENVFSDEPDRLWERLDNALGGIAI